MTAVYSPVIVAVIGVSATPTVQTYVVGVYAIVAGVQPNKAVTVPEPYALVVASNALITSAPTHDQEAN